MKRVLEGLTILAKYVEDRDDFFAAEHDEIFVSGPPPGKLTPTERAKLQELGFDYDRSNDSWHKYV